MSELSKEHFDQSLAGTEKRLIARIDESQAELARMVSSGFEDVPRRLDVTAEIKTFEHKFAKL
jgi:hypothetical protein